MGAEQVFKMGDTPVLERVPQLFPVFVGTAVDHHAFAARFQEHAVPFPGAEHRDPQQITLPPILRRVLLHIHLGLGGQNGKQQAKGQ